MRAPLILILACSMFLVGCPKEKRALNAARKAVEVAAMTVDLVDQQVSVLYVDAAGACLDASPTHPQYVRCIAKWDKTVHAVVAMKSSLLLVETSLDAWEAGSPNGRANLLGAAACFLEGLVRLQGLLTDLGVNAPALDHGLEYTGGLFGLGGIACPSGATA